jgi:sugar lactone lactonase YvrE
MIIDPQARSGNREKHMVNRKGRLGLATLACVGLAIAISTPAAAWKRGSVQNFYLPAGQPMVEGLAVDTQGNVYVATFNPTGSPPAQLFTFGPQGNLLNQVRIQKSSSAMLGLAFRPGTDGLLVIDFGAHQVLSVNPTNGQSVVCITLPSGSQAGAGLNALTFDKLGNVYISDSFQGIIWRFSPQAAGKACGEATAWVGPDPLLLPNNGNQPESVPPFGANGIEFDSKGNMFVANTAIDTIVKIPVSGGSPGTPEVFTNSINGADGIAIDGQDNIWVAANQADEIVVVDKTGKAIAKLGDFNGVQNGETNGLLFPASPAFSPDGQFLWVTNLELDLTTIGITQSVDSQWAAQVTQHSIAKLSASIPPLQ